jgi:hypothetical protein
MQHLAAALYLNWDVTAVSQPVQDRVEAPIEQRKKDVQSSL